MRILRFVTTLAHRRILVNLPKGATMRDLALLVGGVGLLAALVFAVSPVRAGSAKLEPSAQFKAGVTLTSEVVTVSSTAMAACAAKKKIEDENCKKVMASGGICINMCYVCCGKALKVTNNATFTIPKGKVLKVFRKTKVKGASWTSWTSIYLTASLAKGASKTILGGCEQSECIDTGKYTYKVETADPPPPPS
jgi:hypothetical protein